MVPGGRAGNGRGPRGGRGHDAQREGGAAHHRPPLLLRSRPYARTGPGMAGVDGGAGPRAERGDAHGPGRAAGRGARRDGEGGAEGSLGVGHVLRAAAAQRSDAGERHRRGRTALDLAAQGTGGRPAAQGRVRPGHRCGRRRTGGPRGSRSRAASRGHGTGAARGRRAAAARCHGRAAARGGAWRGRRPCESPRSQPGRQRAAAGSQFRPPAAARSSAWEEMPSREGPRYSSRPVSTITRSYV
jgi:hypothetical protein